MQLTIGERVRIWDDDRRRWWDGEVTAIDSDMIDVTVQNGDHPWHPWQEETISVPRDPEYIQPCRHLPQ
jgi:hypothetical protein